jgi:hypothetical protein
MIDVKSIEILNGAICPLKETSKYNHDGNDFYMTNSELSVVDFDAVKNKYIKKLSLREPPKSSDAFYVDNCGEMYLIEFKSGQVRDVWLKICNSLLILTDILNKGISYTRQNLCYILVYNETKNPSVEECELQDSQSRTSIGRYVSEKAGKRFIRFSLERFEKLYFKAVFTATEDEFENRFVRNWSKSDS